MQPLFAFIQNTRLTTTPPPLCPVIDQRLRLGFFYTMLLHQKDEIEGGRFFVMKYYAVIWYNFYTTFFG